MWTTCPHDRPRAETNELWSALATMITDRPTTTIITSKVVIIAMPLSPTTVSGTRRPALMCPSGFGG
jgi:hypothetical protein